MAGTGEGEQEGLEWLGRAAEGLSDRIHPRGARKGRGGRQGGARSREAVPASFPLEGALALLLVRRPLLLHLVLLLVLTVQVLVHVFLVSAGGAGSWYKSGDGIGLPSTSGPRLAHSISQVNELRPGERRPRLEAPHWAEAPSHNQ